MKLLSDILLQRNSFGRKLSFGAAFLAAQKSSFGRIFPLFKISWQTSAVVVSRGHLAPREFAQKLPHFDWGSSRIRVAKNYERLRGYFSKLVCVKILYGHKISNKIQLVIVLQNDILYR